MQRLGHKRLIVRSVLAVQEEPACPLAMSVPMLAKQPINGGLGKNEPLNSTFTGVE
jgi:hypothetical protein